MSRLEGTLTQRLHSYLIPSCYLILLCLGVSSQGLEKVDLTNSSEDFDNVYVNAEDFGCA